MLALKLMYRTFQDYTIKRRIVVKIIIFTFLCFFFFSLINKIKIYGEDTPLQYNINLTITPDKYVNGTLEVTFKNNHNNSLINGYDLRLPFKVDRIDSASINGTQLDKNISYGANSTDIKLSSFTLAIKPNEDAHLIIRFSASLVTSKYNLNYIFLPQINPGSQIMISYDIKYSNELGSPAIISGQDYKIEKFDNSFDEITFTTDNGLFLLWGDNLTVDLESDLIIQNSDQNKIHNLVSLPYEDQRQEVIYKKMSTGDSGLTDDLENNFILNTLNPNETKNVTYQARVKVKRSGIDTMYPQQYNWKLNLDYPIARDINSIIHSQNNPLDNLKALNNFLVSKMQPNLDENINLNSLDDIWKKFDGNSKFSSFEYCYLIIASAESIGLKARMDYGYLTLPINNLTSTSSAHIWCEVLVDNKNVLMDPYMEGLLNLNYFNQNPLDRIKFGVWYPTESYNYLIGLLGDHSKKNTIKYIDSLTFPSSNLEASSAVFDVPNQTFSGEFYSGKLTVKNSNNVLLQLDDLTLNNESIMSLVKNNNLTVTFLPLQSNVINLDYLREKNFLYDGVEKLNIRIIPKETSYKDIITQSQIDFIPDKRLLIFILIILILIIIFLIFMLYRLSKPKKLYVVPKI